MQVVDQAESFRLITDGGGRFAVVEARAGHVYSLHGRQRREAPDSTEGMAAVVGDDGWRAEQTARRRFRALVRRGDELSRTVW